MGTEIVPRLIQLHLVSGISLTYGLQSALHVCYPPGYGTTESHELVAPSFNLNDNGCSVDHKLDCSIACLDPDQVFANPYTLGNCVVLAAIGELGPFLKTYFNTLGFDDKGISIARDFSITLDDPGFLNFTTRVIETIIDCPSQYCAVRTGCSMYSKPDCQSFLPDVTDVCAAVVAPVNADIGGIGVKSP